MRSADSSSPARSPAAWRSTNTTARYMYSLGRERVLPSALGRTHPKHRSPHIASITQSVIALIIVLAFVVRRGTGGQPASYSVAYLQLYGLMAVMGVVSILAIQALVSVAIVNYFRTHHADEHHWWTTTLAPLIIASSASSTCSTWRSRTSTSWAPASLVCQAGSAGHRPARCSSAGRRGRSTSSRTTGPSTRPSAVSSTRGWISVVALCSRASRLRSRRPAVRLGLHHRRGGVERALQLAVKRRAGDELSVERGRADRERPHAPLGERLDAGRRVDRAGRDHGQRRRPDDRLDQRIDVAVVAVGEQVDAVDAEALGAAGVVGDLARSCPAAGRGGRRSGRRRGRT